MAVWQAKRTDHKTECHHKYTLHIFHGWAVCHVSICMLQNCSECTHIIISVQFAKTVVLPRCRLCRFVLFFFVVFLVMETWEMRQTTNKTDRIIPHQYMHSTHNYTNPSNYPERYNICSFARICGKYVLAENEMTDENHTPTTHSIYLYEWNEGKKDDEETLVWCLIKWLWAWEFE